MLNPSTVQQLSSINLRVIICLNRLSHHLGQLSKQTLIIGEDLVDVALGSQHIEVFVQLLQSAGTYNLIIKVGVNYI